MRLNFDVPRGWTFPTLDKLTPPKKGAIKIGPFGSSLKKAEYSESGIRVLGIDHVYPNELVWRKPKYIPPAKYEELTQYTVQTGDVLVTNMGTVGRTCFVPDDFPTAIISSHLIKVSPDFSRVEPSYLCWALNFCPVVVAQIRAKCQGAIMAGFNTSLLKSLHIPLPPLEEQHRIAAILDKADAVRRKRQEAIALTEELLRSAFLEMFGNPVTNPKGWEVVDLKSQVAELRYGTSVKCHDVQEAGDLPILRIPNIVGERISWNDLKYAELEAKEVSKLLLKPGDILFVRTNGNPEYIGRCAVFEEGYGDTLYASYLIRARLKVNVQLYPAFIRDIISFPTYRSRLVSEARTTAGNYNINTEGLGRLRLIKPPLKEQESYIKLRLQLNTREEKQKRQLIESGTLFNSLLQRAFRGEL